MGETSLCLLDEIDARPGTRAQNATEIAELIVQVQRELLWRARALTGNPSDAEDLAQDTAVRALAFQGGPAVNVNKAWMMRILYNLFVDHYRSDKVRDHHAKAVRLHLIDPQPAPAPFWDTLPPGALEEALKRIPAASRVVFTLHAQGLRYLEISRKVGIPVSTVGTRLLRTRRRLRQLLIAGLEDAETSPGEIGLESPPVSLRLEVPSDEWKVTSAA